MSALDNYIASNSGTQVSAPSGSNNFAPTPSASSNLSALDSYLSNDSVPKNNGYALPTPLPQKSFGQKYSDFSDRIGQLGGEMDSGIVKEVGSIVGGLSSVGNWLMTPLNKAMDAVTHTKTQTTNLGDTIKSFGDTMDKHTGVADKNYLDNVFEGFGTAIPYIAGGTAAKVLQIPSLISSLGIGSLQALDSARTDYQQMVSSKDKNAPVKAAGVFAVDLALNTVAHFLGPLSQGGETGILNSVGRVLKSTVLETANYGFGQQVVNNIANKKPPMEGVWNSVFTMAPISAVFGISGEMANTESIKQVEGIINTVAEKGGTKQDAVNIISKMSGTSPDKVSAKIDSMTKSNPTLDEKFSANNDKEIEDVRAQIKDMVTNSTTKNTEGVKPTGPTDITNKLTDEGYSKQDISRIVSDLYQSNPNGDFTQEQIDKVKQDYIPKGKDVTTVISDLSEKGYTPEEQNTILKNLHQQSPDGNFLKADVNKETQAINGQDLYKTEDAKAAEVKSQEDAKTQAEKEKADAKVKIASDAEAKTNTDHETAKNNSELAKGKIEEKQKDFDQSQKDQRSAQKRLQVSTEKERASRVALEEAKTRVVEAQAKGDKAKTMKARIESAKVKTESIRDKIELEKAKEEAKNSVAKTKSLQKELLKAKIEATKAETERLKATQKYVEAQKNTQRVMEQNVVKSPSPDNKASVNSPENATSTQEIPIKNAETQTKTAEESPKITSEIPKGNKVGKSIGEINSKLFDEGFKSLPEDEQEKYNSSTKDIQKEQINALSKEDFKSISLEEKPLPDGMKGGLVWTMARAMAYKEGDFQWFTDLGKSKLGSDISENASNLSLSQYGISKGGAEVKVSARMKEAQDAVKASNPNANKAQSDIINEGDKALNDEMNKHTLKYLEDDSTCK